MLSYIQSCICGAVTYTTIKGGVRMDEEEKQLFQVLIDSVNDLKNDSKKETIEDLKFLKVPVVAKKLGKNEGDTRELMRRIDFPSVPDGKGDLKVEEQAFIRWCRAENIKIKEEKEE